MRTYQILRTNSAADAVANAVIFATAPIWVPVVALIAGFLILNDNFGEPAQEREAIAEVARNLAWLPHPEKLLPASNGGNLWSVKDKGSRHILTDQPCPDPRGRSNQRYLLTVTEASDGTYSIWGSGCYGASLDRVFIYYHPSKGSWEGTTSKRLSDVKAGLPTLGLQRLWDTRGQRPG